jgi:methyl-accepting chemotaxis protein
MKNLKIWQKLTAVALLGVTPVVVLIYLFVTSRNEQIARTQEEMRGLEYIRPVRRFLERVPQHRALASAYLNGDSSMRNKLTELESATEQDVTLVDEVNARMGYDLKVSDAWEVIRRDWRDLKERTPTLTASDSFARHTRLFVYTLALMRKVGDQTGLTRDPEVQTSYLADNLVVQLGTTVDAIDQLSTYGTAVATSRRATAEESAQIIYLIRLVATANEVARRNVLAAEGVAGRLKDQLDNLSSTAEGAAAYFAKKSRYEFIDPAPMSVSSAEYAAAGATAIEQYFTLWDKCAETMQQSLLARVDQLTKQKWIQLMLALAVLLIAGSLMFALQHGIAVQVNSIMDLFRSVNEGNLGARADVHAKDELGMIAGGLNEMLDSTVSLMQSREEKEQIQRSIQHLLDEVSGVAEGDLRKEAEVTSDITGAIADSFNYMLGELRNIIASVQQTTYAVNSSASQVQTTAEMLARGSEEQSTQLVEASTAIDQMAASIGAVSETASAAAVVASEALESAQQGALSVRKTMDGMNAIRTQVQETSKRVKRLGESSQEIGEIVELIGDIADRTSILALNASIQAAMAGEAGKGFAVVADEVERLAERATDATKRIGALIKSVQGDMTEAISAMEATTREVVGGSQLANEAGQRLQDIESVSKKISGLVQQISVVSKQQAAGSETVAKNVTVIADVTQQTAEGVRQAAAATRHLAGLAQELNDSVRRFRLPESEESRKPAAA